MLLLFLAAIVLIVAVAPYSFIESFVNMIISVFEWIVQALASAVSWILNSVLALIAGVMNTFVAFLRTFPVLSGLPDFNFSQAIDLSGVVHFGRLDFSAIGVDTSLSPFGAMFDLFIRNPAVSNILGVLGALGLLFIIWKMRSVTS